MTERVVPHDLEAERAVLGALILHHDAWPDVADKLTASAFFRDAHRAIWRAMGSLAERRSSFDLVPLVAELRGMRMLDLVGGPVYLTTLTDGVPRATNIAHYAAVVEQCAIRRRMIDAAQALITDAYGPNTDTAADLLDKAQRNLLTLSTRATESTFADGRELARGMLADLEARAAQGGTGGLATGWRDLDDLTGGLRPGNLVILAARPSMGKTALAVNLAWRVVKRDLPVALFSLEMSKEELRDRLVAGEAQVSGDAIRSGRLRGDEWTAVSEACTTLDQAPIYIDDAAAQSSLRIRAKCRRLHTQRPLALVVVDYCQLMREPGRFERKDLEVGESSRNLKALAKELGVPVVLLSQLSRECEKRTDKRPTLSDLRESGALEQDADVVWLLYRDEVYGKKADNEGKAELHMAKQRNGPTGLVRLVYVAPECRFESAY